MAQHKPKSRAKASAKRTTTKTPTRAASRKPRDQEYYKRRNQITAIILFAVSLFMLCLIFVQGESLWTWMHNGFLGLFGTVAIAWPILLCYVSVSIALGKERAKTTSRIVMILVLIILLCASVYSFTATEGQQKISFFSNLGLLFTQGTTRISAGLFSGLFGIPFVAVFGFTGARIILVLMIFVMIMVLSGLTLPQIFRAVVKPAHAVKDNFEERRKQQWAEYEDQEIYVPVTAKNKNRINKDANIDIPLEESGQAKTGATKSAFGKQDLQGAEDHGAGKSDKLKNLENVFGVQSAGETEDVADEPVAETIFVDPKNIPTLLGQDSPTNVAKSSIDIPFEYLGGHSDIDIPLGDEPLPAPFDVPERPSVSVQTEVPHEVEDAVALEAAAFAERALEKTKEDPVIGEIAKAPSIHKEAYTFPPVSILKFSEKLNEKNATHELQTNGQMLVETLKSFGVQTKILDISRGPAVTRYELQPAAGVKISKITNLADDIAMNLAASGVRIEAPIPGKAAVGIEVPNKHVAVVRMRDLIESNSFGGASSKLAVALGRDISGKTTVADLGKMPHLLIAGSTGSGKSVCINSLIISLLYKASPDDVRLLMIDPKVVELGVYNGIPHLLVPVVTDPRKAAGALGWAVTEMLSRYKIFADNNVRDLASYNRLVGPTGEHVRDDGVTLKKMPQIVIIIDELADLMMAAPNEVEDSICRLAQMARAAGMHLVIATQRPSVDVITGIIKANIPSRIAFAVSSQIDSRTILDMGGAEKLLGRGDMLFAPMGSSKPIRVQGCFVEDSEVEAAVRFVKKAKSQEYDQDVMDGIEKNAILEKGKGDSGADNGQSDDPVMQDAIKCVMEAGQASTSLLQRRLRVGYARAGRLVDEMEQMGIVGPHEGSKPRQVLLTHQQWQEMLMRQNDTVNEKEE